MINQRHGSMNRNAIILGANSDIGKEISKRLMKDGWNIFSVYRDSGEWPIGGWDLVVCCIGVLNPIGKFFETDQNEWESNVESNTLIPLRQLRWIWRDKRPNASVCFFSGAGTSNSARTYSAYSAAKIMLYKMTELLDDEEPDCKFFILGPGMVRTKIQEQTLRAGSKADNFERVSKFMSDGDKLHGTGTSHDRIFDCLKWCISLPKEVIGGRNIYVPDPFGPELEAKLKYNPRYYKLRRHE